MVEVSLNPTEVRLELTPLEAIWALKKRLTFPLASVQAVYIDASPTPAPALRMPGTHLPGAIKAGTYVWQGAREFWFVRYTGNTVVFELEGFPYTRAVVDVYDPEAVVQRVRAARLAQA